MVKFLTTALGGLTALTIAGLATPSGQAMLGLHQTQPAVPISVISDPGAVNVAAPVSNAPVAIQHGAAPATHPTAAPVARPAATRPAYHPAAARPVYHSAPAARSVPAAPGGVPMGGAGAITNILLNLPQVLQQGGVPGMPQNGPAPQYAPAPPVPNNGGWMPPGQGKGRWRHDRGDQQGNGDQER